MRARAFVAIISSIILCVTTGEFSEIIWNVNESFGQNMNITTVGTRAYIYMKLYLKRIHFITLLKLQITAININ
jgi:hypothetical protein